MKRWLMLLLGLLALAAAGARAVEEGLAPEPATGTVERPPVSARRMLVVSANPLASDAGWRVLKQGGSAIDAAIAVQAVLNLVEPQSSGVGGGAFLLHWDQGARRLQAFDGRETAPARAGPDLFIGADGQPLPWREALVGGRAVGVPGVLRMLEAVHRQHGRLPWAALFAPAIRLSEAGFEVSPRLHASIASGINPGLGRYPEARRYFFDDGRPLASGSRLRNPALAQSLRLIARDGADALYRGPLGDAVVAAVAAARDNPGLLEKRDLERYRAVEREPVCRPFRQYRVCSMPPPTSGGVTLLQILGLLEGFELERLDPRGAEFAHLFTQAARLAYADRGRYLADSDFVRVPVARLLDAGYLRRRAALIGERDMGTAAPGRFDDLSRADDRAPERPSTSHFVVVDADGNAVSITSSIEMAFGSTLMAGGFLLNNQLTDFSFVAEQDGRPVANRVAGGKRPRSSMTPVMVFDGTGRLVLLTGSPGGSRIINYVAQSLLATLVWGLDPQAAVSLPHVSNRNGYTALEAGTAAEALKPALQARGHAVRVLELNSGLHAIAIGDDGRLRGGVDPRREGAARGE